MKNSPACFLVKVYLEIFIYYSYKMVGAKSRCHWTDSKLAFALHYNYVKDVKKSNN